MLYYIKSEANPSDLDTKFDKFKDVHLLLGENSFFRNGPECQRKGIEAAVASKDLVPLDRITLDAKEKALAALEVIKMHQLVVTKDIAEGSLMLQPDDTVDEETIDQAIPCLISAADETISKEHWLSTTTTGYRAQKATTTIRAKIAKVEAFSNYLMSQMKKDFRIFFGALMITFKAVQCWLKLSISDKAP